MILLIFLIVLELALFALAVNWIWHSMHITEGPFIYSRPYIIRWVCEHLQIKDGEKFCELGCGGAEILARLAKRFPQASFTGLEKNIIPFWIAKLRTAKLPNVTIKKINIYKDDWGQYDWFYCFLLVPQMVHIEKKFLAEAKPTATLLSYIFPFPNHKPYKTEAPHKEILYYYQTIR
ncbi:MAG: hypothetical protein WCO55_05950 [Candidatus Falkowbacteria bacterium]